jgi:hypothetical protein
MKATVPELAVRRVDVSTVDVGQLGLGPITIGQLVLRDTTLDIRSGAARLESVEVVVKLRLDLVWHVHIDLLVDSIDIGDTSNLGTVEIPLDVGDLDVPSLHDIALAIPELTGANASVRADPTTNVHLSGVTVDDVHATSTVLPVPDATLLGLALGSLTLDGAAVPGASIGSATVGHVHGAPLTLPALALRGLSLPSASASEILGEGVSVPITRAPFETPSVSLGILQVSLRITPSVTTTIGRLRLSGVEVGAAVEAIELHNVRLPYDALDITLADIGIDTVTIPSIGVQ